MLHVLVVDDHALVAEALAHALTASGEVGAIDTAGAVADVRSYCRALRDRAERPDVALVEYYLGDGSGITAAAILKLYCPDIRVVMMSAESSPGQVRDALAAGCAGFIRKTNGIAELLRLIRLPRAEAPSVDPAPVVAGLPDVAPPVPLGSPLSQRERQTLGLLADGLSTGAIAARMTVSEYTACNHIRNLRMKLGAHTRLEAVTIAARSGLLARSGDLVVHAEPLSHR